MLSCSPYVKLGEESGRPIRQPMFRSLAKEGEIKVRLPTLGNLGFASRTHARMDFGSRVRGNMDMDVRYVLLLAPDTHIGATSFLLRERFPGVGWGVGGCGLCFYPYKVRETSTLGNTLDLKQRIVSIGRTNCEVLLKWNSLSWVSVGLVWGFELLAFLTPFWGFWCCLCSSLASEARLWRRSPCSPMRLGRRNLMNRKRVQHWKPPVFVGST